jgi:hypothetical protein
MCDVVFWVDSQCQMSNVKMTGLIRDTTCGQGHPFPHPIPGAVNLRSPLASLTAARLINLHHFLSLTTKNNSAKRKKKQSIIKQASAAIFCVSKAPQLASPHFTTGMARFAPCITARASASLSAVSSSRTRGSHNHQYLWPHPKFSTHLEFFALKDIPICPTDLTRPA